MALKIDQKKMKRTLGKLSPTSLLSTTSLAHLFGVHPCSIRRYVSLNVLPEANATKNNRRHWTVRYLCQFLLDHYKIEL